MGHYTYKYDLFFLARVGRFCYEKNDCLFGKPGSQLLYYCSNLQVHYSCFNDKRYANNNNNSLRMMMMIMMMIILIAV